MDVPQEMSQALSDSLADLLPVDGVNGVDIGLDASGESLRMRILVSDPDHPPGGLPETIGGFPVLLVLGDPVAEQGCASDEAKHDPLVGGIQIGPRTTTGGLATAGTLGCILRDRASGDPVGVSNAHVICGMPDVLQQPAPHTDPPSGLEELGTVQHCEIPSSPAFFPTPGMGGVSGEFDAATCSVDLAINKGRMANVGEIADLGTVTGFGSPHLGDRVRKRGYKTRLSHGVVDGTLGSYQVRDEGGTVLWWMLGQTSIAMLPDLGLNPCGVWSRHGDSGSVVVNDANEIVALHFAGDGGHGYATDFATVAVALGVGL
ncbi:MULTISPECIES: hypothetical protein [unclassified Streptomyces]|uniref:hypothetical protein n=1 Tax=unclassified Streptomyces TaxID=2593676 RepID=UPI0011AFB736|nr:hypothetical protein [Streptomyces sp. CB02959]